jgi:hypothetical protein
MNAVKIVSGLVVCTFFLTVLSPSLAQSNPPVIFYTDLNSAPPTGGEGDKDGAFLCVYGEHFGGVRGSSSIGIGGVQQTTYKLWADTGAPYKPGHYAKACVQISHQTPLGTTTIHLTTKMGTSNGLPFHVRQGKVYFVAPDGSDRTGDGSSEHPWMSIRHCQDHMAAGDTCYVGNGVKVTSNDRYGAAIALTSSGQPGNPKALVAYPGATVLIDNNGSPGAARALTNLAPSDEINDWTIAGMVFDSVRLSVQLSRGRGLRLVDNDISCSGERCYGYDGGLVVGGPGVNLSDITVLGNRIHDVGCHEDRNYQTSAHPCAWLPTGKNTISSAGLTWTTSQWTSSFGPGSVIVANEQLRRIESCDPQCRSGRLDAPFVPDLPEGTTWKFRFPSPPKFFHNVYFASANSVEFAWNEIDGSQGRACRGLLFHSTGGMDEHDLNVHDNDIRDTVCDCIAFGTVDPHQGPVVAYNNTLHNCGSGSAVVQQSSFAGLYVSNDEDSIPNPERQGQVQFFNNTIYNAGLVGPSGSNNSCFALKTSSTRRHGTSGLWLLNNACIQPGDKGQSYFSSYGTDAAGRSAPSYVSGSNNNCYGVGAGCPEELSSSLTVAPDFLDAAAGNFRLAAKSLMKGAGAPSKALMDQDGRSRGDKPNVGAF